MKILVVSNMFPDEKNPSYGIFVRKFCDQLRSINIEYELVVMRKSSIGIGKIYRYIKFYLTAIFKLICFKYDLIYVHYAAHSSVPVLLVNKFIKMKIYTNVHGSDIIPENHKQEKMQKFTCEILEISTKIIVPSEYFKSIVCEKYNIDKKKVFVYPSGGIDSKIFHKMGSAEIEATKKKYGFNNDKVTFAIVGRISEGKGWDVFIDAVCILNNKNMEANFVIVGEGPQEDKMTESLKDKMMDNSIIRIGLLPHEELAHFYSAIDYLVFPTKRKGESLGLVAIEAMACGTPVIASDFAAPHYYMKDYFNGRLFEAGNSKELADIMNECVYDREAYYKLRTGALNTAEKYKEENIIDILNSILKDR